MPNQIYPSQVLTMHFNYDIIYKVFIGVSPSGKAKDFDSFTRKFKSCYPCQQKTHFCLVTKVRFLNDVCLRQMMLATPMMTASPNDTWLRHILEQTSHHCGTQWSNIIFAKQMHHIAVGDASFDDIQGYALIYLR